MRKYTGSHARHGRVTPILACSLLLCACAASPPPAPAEPPPAAVAKPAAAPTVTDAPEITVTPLPPAADGAPPAGPVLRDDAPLRYVVKPGDTLWDIAAYFLIDPYYWPELWYVNNEIANPHLIYPGDVLTLVLDGRRPQLRREAPPAFEVEKLSPQLRELPLETAVPTIPIEAIRAFLNGPRLVTAEQIEAAPYIVQFLDEHLLGALGNGIYVRKAQPAAGTDYAVVRPTEAYYDPETDELLGYEALPVARAEIAAFGEEVATGTLTRSFREALVGDRLLPIADAQALATDFYPRAPEHAVAGQIIAVYDGVAQIGQYEVVAINRGAREGIERGYVLDIFQTGRVAQDPFTGDTLPLPPLKAGTLLVFQVEDKVSFALVMRATRPIHVLDAVRNPIDT